MKFALHKGVLYDRLYTLWPCRLFVEFTVGLKDFVVSTILVPRVECYILLFEFCSKIFLNISTSFPAPFSSELSWETLSFDVTKILHQGDPKHLSLETFFWNQRPGCEN